MIGVAPVRVDPAGAGRFTVRCAGAVVMAPPAVHVEVEVGGGTAECRVMTVAPDADATISGAYKPEHRLRVRGVNSEGPGPWGAPTCFPPLFAEVVRRLACFLRKCVCRGGWQVAIFWRACGALRLGCARSEVR